MYRISFVDCFYRCMCNLDYYGYNIYDYDEKIRFNKGELKMSLVKCPECGNDVSSSATSCPKCGCPLKDSKVEYEQQVVKIRCWGRGTGSVNKNLEPYTSKGWEVVTMVEDHFSGGWLSPVYKVTLRKRK